MAFIGVGKLRQNPIIKLSNLKFKFRTILLLQILTTGAALRIIGKQILQDSHRNSHDLKV